MNNGYQYINDETKTLVISNIHISLTPKKNGSNYIRIVTRDLGDDDNVPAEYDISSLSISSRVWGFLFVSGIGC